MLSHFKTLGVFATGRCIRWTAPSLLGANRATDKTENDDKDDEEDEDDDEQNDNHDAGKRQRPEEEERWRLRGAKSEASHAVRYRPQYSSHSADSRDSLCEDLLA